MWTFATLLPLIIGDKNPLDDRLWECILLLLEITKYCTARVTSASASYVKALVDQHHKGFTQCYPDEKHTPKLRSFSNTVVCCKCIINNYYLQLNA